MPMLSFETWGERFVASRIDMDENTKKNYRPPLKKIGETFGDRDPATITVDEVAEWVADLAETHKPGTSASTCSRSGCCSTTPGSTRTPPVTRGEAAEAGAGGAEPAVGRALRGDPRGAR